MTTRNHFIVIGAQKCGTTTLDEDLREHPQIWLAEKDGSRLLECGDEPGADAKYWSMFDRAPVDALTGEVTTFDSMLPGLDAVTPARQVFADLKVVYIVRDPVQRVISHHHHWFTEGKAPADIDRAVRELPALVDHSRYATQLTPWLRAFGRDSVHVVRFEDYAADRQRSVMDVHEFLGLDPRPLARPDRVLNAASAKRFPTGPWRRLQHSRAYRSIIRPLVPIEARRRILRQVLPDPPARPPGPSPATFAHLVEELQPEVDGLAAMVGTDPWWDLSRWTGPRPPS